MKRILVEGKSYRVTENLGYVHSAGRYAKAVPVGDGERIAVKKGRVWIWAKPKVLPPGQPVGQRGRCI